MDEIRPERTVKIEERQEGPPLGEGRSTTPIERDRMETEPQLAQLRLADMAGGCDVDLEPRRLGPQGKRKPVRNEERGVVDNEQEPAQGSLPRAR